MHERGSHFIENSIAAFILRKKLREMQVAHRCINCVELAMSLHTYSDSILVRGTLKGSIVGWVNRRVRDIVYDSSWTLRERAETNVWILDSHRRR